jgi:hypothetical protein
VDGGELSDSDVSGYLSEHTLGADAKEMSSYSTESNESILEITIAAEECEQYCKNFATSSSSQRYSSDDKGNPPLMVSLR